MKCLFKSQNGIVLLLVLWVLMVLSVIVGEFCYTMRTEVNITRNFKEDTQAYYIALAGLNRAIAEVVRMEVLPKKPASLEDEAEPDAVIWRVNTDIPPTKFAGGEYRVSIENESGKTNINLADRRLLKMMLNGFELEESEKDVIVDSILDWRDKDHLHRLNGAEDDYYNTLAEPYECKDDDFDAPEELLLVRGVTPEIFDGLKDILTVYKDDAPTPVKRQTSKTKARQRKKTKVGFNKISINAASPQMLRFLPGMTDDLVAEIVEFRKEKDFRSLNELLPILGSEVYGSVLPFLTLKMQPYYTIKSMGMVEDSKTRQGMMAMIKIDRQAGKGYRMIECLDSPAFGG